MAAYFDKIAVHLAYDMFSSYTYLIVNSVLSPSRFLEWEFLSDCTISYHLSSSIVQIIFSFLVL